MTKTIYFDLDGTLADLYSVNNWLQSLRSNDPSPYTLAKPLLNMRTLARYLNKLQKQGYSIGVISWLSKDANALYNEVVTMRKKRWLKKHLASVEWNEMHIVKYGYPKHYIAKDKNGILFDDNEEIRNLWVGISFDEKDILTVLKGLLK